MQHTRRLHNDALGRGQCSCSQNEANNPWTNFPSNHALNHERTAQKRGETQAGSLRQTGSVRGQKTAIPYRRMSGANKSYLRRFAGLCALTVQTASRTAAGEPPRQAPDKQTILETVWDQSRAAEGGKINGHWICREDLSKWQQAFAWFRGLGSSFLRKSSEEYFEERRELISMHFMTIGIYLGFICACCL